MNAANDSALPVGAEALGNGTDAAVNPAAPVQASRLKRLSIFGFSANPPTDLSGHAGIIQSLVESGLYDEVWLLPVYVHIYTTKRNLEQYEHRMEMCRLVSDRLSTASVAVRSSDLERTVYLDEYNRNLIANPLGNPHLEVRVGSIDIVRYVRANFKDCNLLSINLGADSYNDLVSGKWKQHSSLLAEVYVNAFYRTGVTPLPAPSFARGVNFVQLKSLSATSSTTVRSENPGVLADWPFAVPYYVDRHRECVPVFADVYDYIRAHKLYFYSDAALQSRLRWRAAALLAACALFYCSSAVFVPLSANFLI